MRGRSREYSLQLLIQRLCIFHAERGRLIDAVLKCDEYASVALQYVLAATLVGKVPVIYASHRNAAIAYNWKIKMNETGKIPAFMNVIPELNHNEMTGFDVHKSTEKLINNFYTLILRDEEDDPRIHKRMEILERLYNKRDIPTEIIAIEGTGRFEKIFSSLYLADWVAYYTAQEYGSDPDNVPMVEEFKKLMKG